MHRQTMGALPGMAMGMHMPHAHDVAVRVKVNSLPYEAAQHIGAQGDEHKSDRHFQRLFHVLGDRLAEGQHQAAEQGKSERVANSPRDPLPERLGERVLPGGQGGHCRQVIGFGRVLHAEQQADHQNGKAGHEMATMPG